MHFIYLIYLVTDLVGESEPEVLLEANKQITANLFPTVVNCAVVANFVYDGCASILVFLINTLVEG
jgi:hypothetical protein